MRKTMKKIVAGVLAGFLLLETPMVALADSEKVVTLGADLTTEQRNAMLEYFGVTEDEVTIVEVNNQEERKYLEGIATESEIGTHTYSCAYIMPTNTKKINVKTAHLTWVSTSMIANTLVTAGIDSCDVIAAAPKDVSGTGALTGIIKAYEKVTNETLDSDKTELAMEELYQTAELGSDIGKDEAAAVMNEVKTKVLKDDIQDENAVKDVVEEVADYYDVNLSDQQKDDVAKLMSDIGKQDYDYDAIKGTMSDLQNKLVDNMDQIKESFVQSASENKDGIIAAIGGFFSDLFHAIGNFFSNLFGGAKDTKKQGDQDDGITYEEYSNDPDSILNKVDDSALGIEPTAEAEDTSGQESATDTTSSEEIQNTEDPAVKQDSFEVQDGSVSDTASDTENDSNTDASAANE